MSDYEIAAIVGGLVGLVATAGIHLWRWKLRQSRDKRAGIAYHPGFNPFSYVVQTRPPEEPFWCMVSYATGPQSQKAKRCTEQCRFCETRADSAVGK